MDMIFGKLGWDSIPTEPIVLVTMVFMALGAIAVLGGITYFKKWGYLWKEWFTTVDHKNWYHVYHRICRHAFAWFRRCDHDAFTTFPR